MADLTFEQVNLDNWMSTTYPCEDDTGSISSLKEQLDRELRGSEMYDNTKYILDQQLSTISSLMKREDATVEEVDAILKCIDQWRAQCSKTNSQKLELSNGYYLNLDALAPSILFWKYLGNLPAYARRRSSSRGNLEQDFKRFKQENSTGIRFSEVLFCLSWLDLLRVVGNNTVLFNQRRHLAL